MDAGGNAGRRLRAQFRRTTRPCLPEVALRSAKCANSTDISVFDVPRLDRLCLASTENGPHEPFSWPRQATKIGMVYDIFRPNAVALPTLPTQQ